MLFQIKLKSFSLRFLVFFLTIVFCLPAFFPLYAQTAEVIAPAQTVEVSVALQTAETAVQEAPAAVQTAETAVKEAPAAAQTSEAKIEISGQIKAEAPAAVPEAPAAPAQKPMKVSASKRSVYITPGQTFDLSAITLSAKSAEGKDEPVKIESWSADTGSVNLNVYTPPSASFAGTVTLLANYNDAGETKSFEIEMKVRTVYISERIIVLVIALILGLIIVLSINSTLSGKSYFIRKIGGLNAIDEAIGRSTEMGKPVLYLTGLSDVSSIATIASISILSYVARKTAEYETSLLVPCCRSLVMNTAREVVKESYLEAGKPDAYNAENIKYITDDQFGFVSGVDGIMLREKPAANFYLGHFMAESLIYAETGNSIGAIQIAGTSEFSQIPFFVAACDYCLIGEELFAASAYLSRKPKDVGTLRGQDIAKLVIMAIVIIGVVLETVAAVNPGLSSSLGMYKSLFQTK
ncbi:MAG TPA: hypothetical protein PKW98_12860 [Candidatus Wallbacteria bacterium]|nr:hypothetical protein [Candidatus Wallbacteria bacterium]